MSKYSTLSKKTRKAIIYSGIILTLLILLLIFRLVLLAEERSRSFAFTADPSSNAAYQLTYRYDLLDQDDYDSLLIEFSGLENLTFDEVGNSSPQQENSKISKEYGNLQLDLIYPIGSIYKIEGSSITISDQYAGDVKKYSLTLVNTTSQTQVFDSYGDLLTYLEPYVYQKDQKLSTLSIITDAHRPDSSSIRILSNSIGLTQYGFPSGCKIAFADHIIPNDAAIQPPRVFNLQELCPPNQAAYYPGLLDTIGFMDKIDFFINTDDGSGSFPIIVDPNDAYAIVTGNNLIPSNEINSYLFIIDSASRIHLTAHNNFMRVSTYWSISGKIPVGRFSFPHASLEITNLPGNLLYGKYARDIDAASYLQIINGEKIRSSINSTLSDQDDKAFFSRLFVKGLFEAVNLNDRTIIKVDEGD
jgi:hypothetical protein